MSGDGSGVRTKTRFWSWTLPRIHRNAIPTSKLDRTPLSASGCCSTPLHSSRTNFFPSRRLAFVQVPTSRAISPSTSATYAIPHPTAFKSVSLLLLQTRIVSDPSVLFFFFFPFGYLLLAWLGFGRTHIHTPWAEFFFFPLGLGLSFFVRAWGGECGSA